MHSIVLCYQGVLESVRSLSTSNLYRRLSTVEETIELLLLRTLWLLTVTYLIWLLALCCSKRNATRWDSCYLQSTPLFSAKTVYINLPVLYTVTHFYPLHFDVTSYTPITRSLFRWSRYAWLPG